MACYGCADWACVDREILRHINEDAGRREIQGNIGEACTVTAIVNYYLHFKDEETEAPRLAPAP